jgi:hypothetical protein
MVYIYVLKLQENKYYVGKTNNPSFRIENHLNGDGSSWTTIYKPLKLVEMIPNCDDYDEDKYTQKYMDKYGIDNVRGGSFVSIKLNEEEKRIIEKKTNGSNDKCFKCGMKGHFASNCISVSEDLVEYGRLNDKLIRKKNKLNELEKENLFGIKNDRISTIKEQISETESKINELENKCKAPIPQRTYSTYNVACFRCGRQGHYASSCYAKTTIQGEYINENKCLPISKSHTDINECYRCGRQGHYASSCYATTNVEGEYIYEEEDDDEDEDEEDDDGDEEEDDDDYGDCYDVGGDID